jgi:wyosine [tRNA(Phe)-imidazoG37] synthetase (radical SAM superfamily)
MATTPVLMPLHEGVVYGPIRSRRLGRSLGINLLPPHLKICTFNCSYCQYGWTHQSRRPAGPALDNWPAPAAVVKAVGSALKTLLAHGDHVDRLTLAGHGEPTMHPQFPEIVRGLRNLRTQLVPGVPIALLSNSSTLDKPEIRKALLGIDERYFKLDAGDAHTLRTINASSLPFDQVVEGLKNVPDVVIQAMFVKDRTGRIDNTSDYAVISWVGALQRIKPKAVHIYTLDRAPAWPYLQAVPAARLREIQQRVRMAGLTCEVFGVPNLEEAAPVELAVRH